MDFDTGMIGSMEKPLSFIVFQARTIDGSFRDDVTIVRTLKTCCARVVGAYGWSHVAVLLERSVLFLFLPVRGVCSGNFALQMPMDQSRVLGKAQSWCGFGT